VRFVSRGPGYTLFLTADEAVLAMKQGRAPSTPSRRARDVQRRDTRVDVVRMRVVGARPDAEIAGREQLPGRVNYLVGRDPARWRTGIPTYARVHYRDVYPGIDLVYHGDQRRLEYDFVVRAGADPKKIRLAFEGAGRPTIDRDGHLTLHLAGGALRQLRPVVYQEVGGVRRPVDARYVLRDGHVGFQLAAYDPARSVVIDPVIVYSTYLGGSEDDEARGISVDAAGNAYIAGLALSVDFPTTATSVQATSAGSYEAFVTKLDASGMALVYSTYLGGSGDDGANGIAVTTGGEAVVAGFTTSADFPTSTGPAFAGDVDAFVTRLNAAGNGLVYSRFVGGAGDDEANSVVLDAAGNAYAVGFTSSVDYPTTLGVLHPTYRGGPVDAFLTKVGPTGTIVLSTYLGGGDDDQAWGVALDAAGSIVVSGTTASADFPTAAAIQPVKGAGYDAFVTKLNATASVALYSTFLGGSGFEAAGLASSNAVTTDAAGSAYVTGCTGSPDFPVTAGAYQTTFGGGVNPDNPTCGDMFVTKLSAAGALTWSTYIGGSGFDNSTSIAVDSAGNAFVAGYTQSQAFPAEAALSIGTTGGQNIVVLKLNADGASLAYSTLIGGSVDSWGYAVAVDAKGNAWVTGRVTTGDFPTTPGAFQTTYTPPGGDAFVIKLDPLAVKNPGDQTNSEGTTVLLQIEASGPVGDPLTYSATGLPPDLTINAVTGTITGTLSFTSAGVYHPIVTVAHGTVTASTSFTWTVLDVNRPPNVTNPGPQTSDEGTNPSLPIVASDPDGDPITFTATGLPPGLAINPTTGVISGSLDFNSAGIYAVTVTVTDSQAASTSVSFTWTVKDVNRPPVVTNPGDQTNHENTTVSLPITATDPDGDAFVFSATGLPPALTIHPTTGVISGTLTFFSAGVYTVTVSATDTKGATGTTTFRWTVLDANRPPTVTNPGDQTNNEFDVVSLQIDASDPDGDALTYSATGLPPALTINPATGRIAGVLSGDSAGTYSVVVTVSDGKGGTASAAFIWTVNNVDNRPPVCTGAVARPSRIWPPNHQQVNVAIVGVNDPDGDPVTIRVVRILQDEPTNGPSDGNTPIDGGGVGTSTPWVRAERSAQGNGRVYEIFFVATDARGAACSGSVKVGVPKEVKSAVIDSGVRYDSTVAGGPPL
jgi:hypothetical protein